MSGSRFVVKASCFAVMAGAGLLSGAAIGVLLGIIGSLLFETAALLPIVVVLAVGGAIDVTGHLDIRSFLDRHELLNRSDIEMSVIAVALFVAAMGCGVGQQTLP